MRASPRLTTATLGLVLLVAACRSGAAAPTANPSAVADVPASPVASPDVTPAPVSDPSPSADPEPEPTKAPAKPAPTAAPANPEPTDEPAVAFTPAEQRLLDGLRVNAAVNCVPRRSDLPVGATAGIECHVGTALVDRVGAYQFPTDDAALELYLDRMESNGVEIGNDGCTDGTPGEAAWTPGDEPGQPVPHRSGCFVEEGLANSRVLCGGGVYLGILGPNDDLAALTAWVNEPDENFTRDTPHPPAICYGPGSDS